MDAKTQRRESKGKHSFRIGPTWQRFCISDLPSACQYSSSGNIAKKHKNKLFAITAVPMGTGPQRVCPLRHSSAQTVCKPTPQHATQTRRGRVLHSLRHLHHHPQPLFSQNQGLIQKPCYQCKRLAGPACEKCHKGKKDQDS